MKPTYTGATRGSHPDHVAAGAPCAPPEAPGPIPRDASTDVVVFVDGIPEIPWLADGAPVVDPPRIPWLAEGHPALPAWQCPPGWRSVPGPDGEAPCDPWPEEGRVDCLLDHEAGDADALAAEPAWTVR